jgi:hypothetical protein
MSQLSGLSMELDNAWDDLVYDGELTDVDVRSLSSQLWIGWISESGGNPLRRFGTTLHSMFRSCFHITANVGRFAGDAHELSPIMACTIRTCHNWQEEVYQSQPGQLIMTWRLNSCRQG